MIGAISTADISNSSLSMPQFRTTRRVRHSARQMFDLVADVEQYPQFLPLCESLRVRERRMDGDVEVLVADMNVAYGPFRETFTSRVRLLPQTSEIMVEYVNGPFRHLNNSWSFAAVEDGICDVTFFIDWEMKSKLLSITVGAIFEQAFRKFTQAFEARADTIYKAK
jgi:coenzyme Q-binding protein COQ10